MRIALFVLVLLSSGCVAWSAREGFDDLHAAVHQRTGLEVHWNEGGESDRLIRERIDALLSVPLTAESAAAIALLNNPKMQALYEDLAVAQADLLGAGLLANPVLSGEVRIPPKGLSIELSFVQQFIEVLQIPLRKKVAESLRDSVRMKVIGEVLALSGETTVALYRHQAASQRFEVGKRSVLALDAALALAQSLHRAGNINDLMLRRAEAELQAAKLDLAVSEQDTVRTREAVTRVLGLSDDSYHWKTTTRLPTEQRLTLRRESLEHDVVTNSVTLAQQRREIDALIQQRGIATRFALFSQGEAGVSAESEGGSWGFGPAFALPLPIFNQNQPAILRADASVRRAHQLYAARTVELRSMARSLHGQLEIARARAAYFRETLLPLKGLVVRETERQYNAMQIGAYDLIAAKHDEIEAGRQYVDALERFWLLSTELTVLLQGKLLEIR